MSMPASDISTSWYLSPRSNILMLPAFSGPRVASSDLRTAEMSSGFSSLSVSSHPWKWLPFSTSVR